LPRFLPDGKHFIYSAAGVESNTGIYFASLDGRENQLVARGVGNADFSSGLLFYPQPGTTTSDLMALPLDPSTGHVKGEPQHIVQGIQYQEGPNQAAFAVSNRLLVYQGSPTGTANPQARNRKRPPVHVLGIDEVSRRKGQVYLTVVYDLERRVLLWVGEDRTEEAVKKFFTQELGKRRCSTLQVVCMDMWAAYVNLVREHAPQAQILFDRFHIVKHLQEAVDEVRRSEMRRLTGQEKVTFKSTRWLLLKNPWNLTSEQKERLSTLVRWNSPIVRAYYLKESFQLFWDYKQEKRAQDLLSKWMHSAMRSRLEPFKKFVRMLRSHLSGILPWTKLRLSNGAVEGMNNKIKSISHRSFGFRSTQHFVATIYHCCAKLPLPAEC
jgi:hypothetical protein